MPRFVEDIFLDRTTHSIYVCSLPNTRGHQPGERHVLTRDPDKIERFVKRWDVPGRGLFYCAALIRGHGPRDKDHYGETTFLHADVDFKSIVESPEEAEAALLNLAVSPTRIHKSGNGLHALWRLSDPISAVGEVEAALKLIRDCVAGDPAVAHCVALMRWPGSHNTKNEQWTEVSVIRDTDLSWPIQEVAAFFKQAPRVLRRKDAPEDNAFTRAASVLQFKPPIDVDEALKSMSDGNVHNTQLTVTASLLSSGVSIDDAVARVVEATRKVPGSESWNWDEEERAIRGMCEDWNAKHPPEERRPAAKKPNGGGDFREDDATISLNAKRMEKQDKQAKDAKATAHHTIAKGIVDTLDASQQKLMCTTDNTAWLYSTDGIWREFTDDQWRSWVARNVEVGCVALKLRSTQKLVNETKELLKRLPSVVCKDPVPWDQHKLIATRSGLIDWQSGPAVVPYAPDHYASHRIEADYDPGAQCAAWLCMLTDMGMDDATITVLQELLGAAMVDNKPRSLMKALVLVGPSNSGKSNVLRVFGRFLSDNPIATSLDILEKPHGTMDFLRRAPWVVDEAFDQGKWHFSSAVKALLSGDPVAVNVKNGPISQHTWRQGAFWGTNVPPQFKEQTRAMENRMIIVTCQRTFDPDQPTGAALTARRMGYAGPAQMVLAEERSGLLNWALAGLKRAWDRGYFVQTEAMRQAVEDVRMESNVAARFVKDYCVPDPDAMVANTDCYAAFRHEWEENTSRNVPSPDSFGRAMAALAEPRIAVDRTLKHRGIRVYCGFKLNEEGLDHWQAQFNATAASGDAARVSASASEVNQSIPSEWSSREVVRKMRAAFSLDTSCGHF